MARHASRSMPGVCSRMAAGRLLLAGLLAVLLTSSPAAAQMPPPPPTTCPEFQCTAPDQCSLPQAGSLSATGPGQFSALSVNVDGSAVSSYKDCCASCDMFKPVCAYWSYAVQDTGEPICYLYTSEICNPSNGVQFTPCELKDKDFSGSNFTTGSICPSVLSPPPPSAGVVGDPHYTGADQSHFDFTGLPGKHYCMLSDAHIHINVFHGGRYDRWGDNPHKPLTWIRQLAVLWGHHTIHLAAREGPEWRYGNGYVAKIAVDGQPVQLSKPGALVEFFEGKIRVQWVAARQRSGDDEIDVYEITIHDALRMIVRARPEVALLRTKDDGVVHFGVELAEVAVSARVHGVLGQTFRDDHRNRLALQKLQYSELLKVPIVPGENAEGFIDGHMADYETSSLFRADCAFSRFARNQVVDAETAEAIEISSGAMAESSYTGESLPRKMMRTVASSK